MRNLLEGGLLHEDVNTVAGKGLAHYTFELKLLEGKLEWVPGVAESSDLKVLRPIGEPFAPDGGLRLMQGCLSRDVKISAVAPEHRKVVAPAIVFESREAVQAAFDTGEIKRDFVAVVRFQGARANRHARSAPLTPLLGVLQDQGFPGHQRPHVRCLEPVPAVIHVSPEALLDGPLASGPHRRHHRDRRAGRRAQRRD